MYAYFVQKIISYVRYKQKITYTRKTESVMTSNGQHGILETDIREF